MDKRRMTNSSRHSLRTPVIAATLLLVLAALPLPVVAEEARDTLLYIEGLESLLDERFVDASRSFDQLIERYPGSPYRSAAAARLARLAPKPDTAGIVTFYLGNLAVGVYTAMRLPDLLGYDLDTVMIGVTGLAGVATGLGSAWLMSRDYPVSAASDWWIESTQIISLGNYLYLSGIVQPYSIWEHETAYKINLGAQLLTMVGSRAAGWLLFRENAPPKGQGSFMLHSYGWANIYWWLFAGGILELDSERSLNIGGLAVSNLAAAAGVRYWNELQWSPLRTGLVTVGGLGGGLIGFFSVMILEELFSLDSRLNFGLLLASAAAGKGAAVWFTRNMPGDGARSGYGSSSGFEIYPVVTAGGAGAVVRVGL